MRISDWRRYTNNGGKVHRIMEDNEIRITTETREDINGSAVDMQDNKDGRQGVTATDWEILTGNDYQTEGVSLLRENGDGRKSQQ